MSNRTRIILIVAASTAVAVLGMAADVQFRYAGLIGDLREFMPGAQVAMVLGASIKSDGTPSDALRDRLDKGIELYRSKRVAKILLTGDDGAYHADEIDVMKTYALAQGVPEGDIQIDGKGYRTYESCKNAKAAGIVDAIVVTQRFHMGRALYLCNRLGVDAAGVTSDTTSYDRIVFFWIRDLAASLKAWWDVNIWAPQPPV